MKRQYTALVEEYLRYFPCVVLVGARQTGKSTLLGMIPGSRPSWDLERRADYQQIARDPDLFLRNHAGPISIDEAQLLPELFAALRVAIDNDRRACGRYLLSGSSSPELLGSIAESLAGRVGVIEIAPLSFAEVRGVERPGLLRLFRPETTAEEILALQPQASPAEIETYWMYGGYPEPWLRDQQRFREVWREQYLKTYVERDISRLFPGMNLVRFRRFIDLLAASSGDIVNYSNLARTLDISQPTARDYLRIAHGSFFWRTLPAYTRNAAKRLVKHPRGYLRDSGLLHHLLHIGSPRQLLSHPKMGASWEALVIEEILRGLNAAGIAHGAGYYRTSAGAEIDLVIDGAFGTVPIEIKHTQNVNSRSLRAISDFVDEAGCRFGIVVNNDDRVRQYQDRIFGVPFSALCSEIGEPSSGAG